MKRLRSTIALASLACLAACVTVDPTSEPPFELKPAPHRSLLVNTGGIALGTSAVVAYVDSATGADHERLLIDLPNALALCGARSVDVRYAEAKVEEARQGIYSALGSFLPTAAPGIALREHGGITQRAAGDFLQTTKQAEFGGIGATAQWVPGNAIFRALAASRRTDAAEAATDTARAEMAVGVAEGYYRLVRARSLVKIAQQAYDGARELQRIETLKEAGGSSVKANVLRAQAEVAQRDLRRVQTEAEVESASAHLAALLELEPDVELVPAEDAPIRVYLVSSEVPVSQLLEKAENARPELRESSALIDASERDYEGAKWGPLVPEVDAGVATGHFGPTFGQSRDQRDFVGAVGWKIGPGGLFDIPEINARAARVKQGRLRDEGLRVEIARQVVDARARAAAADKAVAAARNGVVAAQETYRLVTDKFEKGAGIILEVLDALSALTRAQVDEVDAIVDFDDVQYRLLRAIGEPIAAVAPPR